jgi:hypothetical protein
MLQGFYIYMLFATRWHVFFSLLDVYILDLEDGCLGTI